MIFVAFKGATAWEMQVGRLWFVLRFPRFWRTSWLGFIRIAPRDD